jgi:hypothetical protein
LFPIFELEVIWSTKWRIYYFSYSLKYVSESFVNRRYNNDIKIVWVDRNISFCILSIVRVNSFIFKWSFLHHFVLFYNSIIYQQQSQYLLVGCEENIECNEFLGVRSKEQVFSEFAFFYHYRIFSSNNLSFNIRFPPINTKNFLCSDQFIILEAKYNHI